MYERLLLGYIDLRPCQWDAINPLDRTSNPRKDIFMAKILAVDDSASIRQMVSLTLRDAGHQIIEAVDGQQALDIARGEAVDAAIIDINMPRLDGISLVRELRRIPAYRFTPLLILTTESSPDKKQAGRAAGATGWIVKPFHPDKLLATVRKVIR